MNRRILIVLVMLGLGTGLQAQTFRWSRTVMDGSRTGVRAATPEDVTESLGSFKGRKYIAPDGRVFRKGTTPRVARILLDAQPEMAEIKTVVGHSTMDMVKEYPECELSNWFVDAMMEICRQKSGKPVDMGILNFGGIRVDMPGGPVLLDDIMSMFPFKNNLCRVELKGKEVRALLDHMAAAGFQALGGVRCTAQDGRIVSAEIGGAPIDDEKVYGVMTISFLLNGGDGISVARDAVSVQTFDEYVLDVILPYVRRLEAEGKMIDARKDGRVKILDSEGNVMPYVRL